MRFGQCQVQEGQGKRPDQLSDLKVLTLRGSDIPLGQGLYHCTNHCPGRAGASSGLFLGRRNLASK